MYSGSNNTRPVYDSNDGCAGIKPKRSFYANDLINGVMEAKQYQISNGSFVENGDGTATFTGTFSNFGDSNLSFDATINFGGRTESGTPQTSQCYATDTGDWYYYSTINGTLIGTNDLAGAEISVSSIHALQIGTGASLYDEGEFGASAWLNYSIVSQPTGSLSLNSNVQMDINWLSETISNLKWNVCRKPRWYSNIYRKIFKCR